MGFYHHYVFPYVLDLAMSSRVLHQPRRRTLAPARGRILEIGFGTGRNLEFYPPTVKRIEAIDPDFDLDRLSMPRLKKAAVAVDFHHMSAEHLPFPGASFDTVVSTLTMCSIPDIEHAVAEVRRVLKPGGQFLFLEHGLSPDPRVAEWQRRLTPLQKKIGGGCHLDRPIRRLLEQGGFHIEPVQTYYLKQAPRFVGYMTEGIAVAPAA